jgi:hypothetical protein
MGVLDDLTSSFGPEALQPRLSPGRGASHWLGLCVCGHTAKAHSPSIGGEFVLAAPKDKTLPDGRAMEYRMLFDGCRGAVTNRAEVTEREENGVTDTLVYTHEIFLPTCPCPEFREVAKVDRPNRYFNQRIPRKSGDWEDPLRHPFAIGIRAFNTFLSKRRAALSDPAWAIAEFERRFEWTHRRCALSRCKASDGVWPVYINVELDSELRCAAHR